MVLVNFPENGHIFDSLCIMYRTVPKTLREWIKYYQYTFSKQWDFIGTYVSHTVQSYCNIRKSTLHLYAMVPFQKKKLFNTKYHFLNVSRLSYM